MKLTLISLFLFFVILSQATAKLDSSTIESLKQFRDGFEYFPITWPLETVDPCEAPLAYAETLICEDNRITELRLGKLYDKIRGTISPVVNSFTDLQVLDLFDNEISGEIPDMSALQNLQELYLNRNQLGGEIPETIGELDALEVLFLSNNQLTGKIPKSLSGLKNLEALYLSSNNLGGPIPSKLGKLKNLKAVSLQYNNLTGPLPENFNKLTQLVFLYLQYNHLSGNVPAFDSLSELKVLHASGNQLTGDVPAFQNMHSLRALLLAANRLNGTISENIAQIGTLEQLVVSSNVLTGRFPSGFQKLHLTRLDFAWNFLTGPVPNFEILPSYLDLSENNLENLPAILTSSPPADYFMDLRNNSFVCPLPQWCDKKNWKWTL